MPDVDQYNDLVNLLGRVLHPVFGDVWVGSVLNECNVNKSDGMHAFVCNKKARPYHFAFTRSLINAVKKWLTFLYLKLYFKKYKKRSISKDIVINYFGNHLPFLTTRIDCLEIIMPQKSNYTRVKLMNMFT